MHLNILKTQRKLRSCERTIGKQFDNTCVAWKRIENVRETQVFRGNLLKTHRKHKLYVGTYRKSKETHKGCVGTYGKRKENTGVAWEPMENNKKTQVLRGNLQKTQ